MPTNNPTCNQCRHIFPDGHRCGSPSLRGENFCYYHHTTRAQFKKYGDPIQPRYRDPFTLPIIEDRTSLQTALNHVLQALVTNELDRKRAGLLLYGLQIAVQLLPQPQPRPTKSLPATSAPNLTLDPITDPILDPDHGLLAPIAILQAVAADLAGPRDSHDSPCPPSNTPESLASDTRTRTLAHRKPPTKKLPPEPKRHGTTVHADPGWTHSGCPMINRGRSPGLS